MSWTVEQQAANRAKWVAALRSGEFKQGRKQLRSDDGEFCCLGVACELAAREGVIRPWADKYDGEAMVLSDTVQDWLGLTDNTGDTIERHDINDDPNHIPMLRSCLTELNDGGTWSFAQIADLIESGGVKVQGGAS